MEQMIRVSLNLKPSECAYSVGWEDRPRGGVDSSREHGREGRVCAVWAGDSRFPRLGRGCAFATLAYFRSGRVDRVEA
jgi:hypothetical protein